MDNLKCKIRLHHRNHGGKERWIVIRLQGKKAGKAFAKYFDSCEAAAQAAYAHCLRQPDYKLGNQINDLAH